MRPLPSPSRPSHGFGLRSERGFTLTELALVGVLAVLVILGLTGFYFNSQKMWVEGSTQAMTQRDATLILDVIGRKVHEATSAIVDTSDPLHHRLMVYDRSTLLMAEISWDADDSRIHALDGDRKDLGPIADSRVLRFQLTTVGNSLVQLQVLEMLSAEGDTVRTASQFALLSQ